MSPTRFKLSRVGRLFCPSCVTPEASMYQWGGLKNDRIAFALNQAYQGVSHE